jgi:DNA-binding IclR family transcriptional regulator
MAASEPRGIQSIEVSGRILNVLLETTGAVMLKDIAAKTDMHAYLSSFKRMDLVVQDPGDGRYSLGALALRLGLAYRDSYAPLRNASETLAVVEARTGLMCALVIWSNGKPTAFEVRAGRQVLNVNLRPGMVFSVTGSPVGEQAADRVRPGQWQMSAEEFATLRYNVTDCGFAALAGQPIAGVNSVAIPVQEPDGTLVGAILMIGNETDMDVTCGADLYAQVRAILKEKSQEVPR